MLDGLVGLSVGRVCWSWLLKLVRAAQPPPPPPPQPPPRRQGVTSSVPRAFAANFKTKYSGSCLVGLCWFTLLESPVDLRLTRTANMDPPGEGRNHAFPTTTVKKFCWLNMSPE